MGDGAHLAHIGATASAAAKIPIPTSESTQDQREEQCGLPECLNWPRSLKSNKERVGDGPSPGAGGEKTSYQGYPKKFTKRHIEDDLQRRSVPLSNSNDVNKEKLRLIIFGTLRSSGFLNELENENFCKAIFGFVIGDLMHNSGSHNKNCFKLVLNMLSENDRTKVMNWLKARCYYKAKNRMIDCTMIAEALILLWSGKIDENEKEYPTNVKLPDVAMKHFVVHMKLRGLLMKKSPGAQHPAHILRIQIQLFLFDRTMYDFSEAARDWQIGNRATSKKKSRFGGNSAPTFEVFHGLYAALMRNYRIVCRITAVFDYDCSRYEALFIPLRNVTHYRTTYQLINVFNAMERWRIASSVKKIIDTLSSAYDNQTEHKLSSLCKENPSLEFCGPLPDPNDPQRSDDDKGEWIEVPEEFVSHFSWSIIFLFTLGDLDETAWYYPDGKEWADIEGDFRRVRFKCNDSVTTALQQMSIAHMNNRDVFVVLSSFAERMINTPSTTVVPGVRSFNVSWELMQDQLQKGTETGKALRVHLTRLKCVSGSHRRMAFPKAGRDDMLAAKAAARQKEVNNKKRKAQDAAAASGGGGKVRRGGRKRRGKY